MIGRTVSHYKILGPLGSGGMGVVYLAEDERLGRQVALKFLPATWSQERTALERFRVEARAASSLSHPGICAIFDIGEDGDAPFIVMEALKGETLRERISKGPLKVADVLDIGVQLADALEAAHAQGIVHRDIKPANIFIGEKNRVKVLDFGLAKLMSSSMHSSGVDTTSPAATLRATEHHITIPGTALGTVSYMSPEQARGEDVDSRTDLFSLGAVLYEMVTGRQAFGGSTTAVVYDAILNRAPRSIVHLNPLVPTRLETVIATLLEKERELRYQHASDLQAELKRIRRDIDSASLAGSQASMLPPRESAPSLSGAPAPPANPAPTRTWERGAIAVAVLAVVMAGLWVAYAPPVGEPPVAQRQGTAAPAPEPAQAAPELPAPAPVQPPPQSTQPAQPTRPDRRAPAAAQPAPVVAPPALAPSVTPAVVAATPAPETSAPPPAPAPASPAATNDNLAPPPASAPPPATAPPPAAVAPAPVTATPPPSRSATPVETPPTAPAPPAAPVENDDAAIRSVIRSYEQAIETKDIRLYRAVRPGLTAAAERTLRSSFQQVDSQQVDIRVDSLNISGRTATARITRRDTLVTRGQRRTENSSQTLRFEKTAAGWVIAE